LNSLWGWVGFNIVVLAILALDLGVLHKRDQKVSVREAATWSAVWVALSLSFALAIYLTMGKQSGLEFLTGYLIEYALSVDNIFVFVLIFSYFNVPEQYQHRVLFWGIIGALVLRGVMIGAGSALVTRFRGPCTSSARFWLSRASGWRSQRMKRLTILSTIRYCGCLES
jgi:tellurite resistance protein TerC